MYSAHIWNASVPYSVGIPVLVMLHTSFHTSSVESSILSFMRFVNSTANECPLRRERTGGAAPGTAPLCAYFSFFLREKYSSSSFWMFSGILCSTGQRTDWHIRFVKAVRKSMSLWICSMERTSTVS